MSTNRETLIKTANLVRPALASQAYIPALTHIRFDGKHATAYNDIAAISVRCDLDAQRLIPGEMLIRALGSFQGESIIMQEDSKGAVIVKSGRSKMTLPTLPIEKFPLELPTINAAAEIALTADIRKAIQRCLMSVGNDPTHPAQMGVTLDFDGDSCAVLYSTDNVTISQCQTDTRVELPGDVPLILPTFFCEQLLKLAGAFPGADATLYLYDGALLAEFNETGGRARVALVFSKVLVDQEPLEFPKIMAKHCDVAALKGLAEIPAGMDEALDRAMLVLGGEMDKATRIEQKEDSFTMQSSSQLGDADDRFKFDHDDREPFSVDPGLLARGAKACSKMAFLPRVLVLANEDQSLIHIISHVVTK